MKTAISSILAVHHPHWCQIWRCFCLCKSDPHGRWFLLGYWCCNYHICHLMKTDIYVFSVQQSDWPKSSPLDIDITLANMCSQSCTLDILISILTFHGLPYGIESVLKNTQLNPVNGRTIQRSQTFSECECMSNRTNSKAKNVWLFSFHWIDVHWKKWSSYSMFVLCLLQWTESCQCKYST